MHLILYNKNVTHTKSYNYYQGDYDSFNNYLKEIDWPTKFNGHNINHNYNLFVQTILSSLDTYIPKTKKKDKTNPPWWSKKLTRAVTHKSTLFIKWKTTKATVDYHAYAKQRNNVKAMIRSAQYAYVYEKNLIQQSQAFISLFKSKQKIRHDITQLQKSDGSTTTSDPESAEELNNFFKSTFTVETADNIPTIPTKIFDSLSDISLTEDIIFHKLLALNGNKAPGPDALHPHLLKSCAASLTTPLFLLAQQSLTSGSLPNLWKRAHVIPIHKRDVNFSHQTTAQSASHPRW